MTAELNFLLDERISTQWAGFLHCFSAEIMSQLSPQECLELLRSVGERFGASLDVGHPETMEELEDAINNCLRPIHWGYVRLRDAGEQVDLYHHLSPLSQTLGLDNEIANGFFEGLYSHVFRAAGAEEGLTVRQVLGRSTLTTLYFQFGRHA